MKYIQKCVSLCQTEDTHSVMHVGTLLQSAYGQHEYGRHFINIIYATSFENDDVKTFLKLSKLARLRHLHATGSGKVFCAAV